MKELSEIFKECKRIVFEDNNSFAKKWKKESPDRVLIGIIPNYFPREIIHAANGLAVGIIGEGLKYPSINKHKESSTSSCSMLEGLFDIVRNKNYKDFDGFILPSQCHTLSNNKEIKKINKKGKFIRYINFPQYFQTIIGDVLNHYLVLDVLKEIKKINHIDVTTQTLNNSIQLFKDNLKLTEKISSLREKNNISQNDLYYTVLAGLLIPIEEHNEILRNIIELLDDTEVVDDKILKVYAGAYC
jgi:benzoyl-CoA reductase subunit C